MWLKIKIDIFVVNLNFFEDFQIRLFEAHNAFGLTKCLFHPSILNIIFVRKYHFHYNNVWIENITKLWKEYQKIIFGPFLSALNSEGVIYFSKKETIRYQARRQGGAFGGPTPPPPPKFFWSISKGGKIKGKVGKKLKI